MDNIIVAFNVIAPVLFLMVIGYVLVNYTNLADRNLTKKANAIVFKIFLPCMLFFNIYKSDIGEEIGSRVKLCVFAAASLLILFVILCLVVPHVVKRENQQGVVIQAIFRSNYVIFGVAVVQNMYGSDHTTTAAILSAILVPMYNFLAVVALSIFGAKREKDCICSGNSGIACRTFTSDSGGNDNSGSGKARHTDRIYDSWWRSGLFKDKRKSETIRSSYFGKTGGSSGTFYSIYCDDGIQGFGSFISIARVPDSNRSFQLYYGTGSRGRRTACRTAGGIFFSAVHLHVVCDNFYFASDGDAGLKKERKYRYQMRFTALQL